MTSNNGYIHIILYDIPSNDLKGYRQFRKRLLSEGYYQLQESVYCSRFKEKKQAEKSKERIYQSLPTNGDVRSLILTTDDNIYIKWKYF